jgi:hypothetical protein
MHLLVLLLAIEARGRRAATLAANAEFLAAVDADNQASARRCDATVSKDCCGDGVCSGSEDVSNCLADCPGVTTHPTCGEEPHSDRGGRGLTFGVGHRAASAQECCDKCKAKVEKNPKKPCNSWTFCGLPVCWGLDSGWNHTFGECWLRSFVDVQEQTFGQRGKLTAAYRAKHMNTRPTCRTARTWHACPPTHVPWTSGSLGGPSVDLSVKYQTGGGWGNMQWSKEGEPLPKGAQ